MFRLLQYNIDGKMYRAVRSLYADTQCCVKLNENVFTNWFDVTSGVKQGDNLSPTLFSLYINELCKEINSLKKGVKVGHLDVSMLLYADDMVLIAESEGNLQEMLNSMYNWCRKWRLVVNESKTNIVHFRKSRKRCTEFIFKYGDNVINVVKEYKYLGVILDEHLNYKKCSSTLAESGGRALSAIISKFKQFKDIGYNTFTTMYNAGVSPVMYYGSSIWGVDGKNNHADNTQNRAIRYFLGVHNFTPIPALVSEMGWLPSKYAKWLCMLQFWNRIIKMSNDRLTKCIFNIEYNIYSGGNNWCEHVKEIMRQLDELDKYDNRVTCNIEKCKDKMLKLAEEEWKKQIILKPKLRTYVKFKNKLEVSDYVKNVTRRYDRSMVAKFRCGILQLHVETGRYNSTKLEDRTCNICNTGCIEDEYHFLCICPIYATDRNKMFNFAENKNNDFTNMNMEERFVYLMTVCSFSVTRFIKSAWEQRKAKLYKH